jgi:hypothetical protein
LADWKPPIVSWAKNVIVLALARVKRLNIFKITFWKIYLLIFMTTGDDSNKPNASLNSIDNVMLNWLLCKRNIFTLDKNVYNFNSDIKINYVFMSVKCLI